MSPCSGLYLPGKLPLQHGHCQMLSYMSVIKRRWRGRKRKSCRSKSVCKCIYWRPLGRIPFSQSSARSLSAHTHVHTRTRGAELGLLSGWWLVELKIDRSHRRCRQMINSPWVVLSARWEAEKPLTLQDLSSRCDIVRVALEWSGVEGLLVNFLLYCIHTGRAGWSWYWSQRCLWFLCRMRPGELQGKLGSRAATS